MSSFGGVGYIVKFVILTIVFFILIILINFIFNLIKKNLENS